MNSMASNMDTYVQWLFDVIQSLKDLMVSKVMMILWSIWHERNERRWNCIARSNSSIVFHDLECLYEWLQAKHQPSVSRIPRVLSKCSKWHPPPLSFVKCNCDAMFFYDRGETCLGIVLRAESGDLLANKMIKLPSLHAIKECEVLALFDAISGVRTLEYNQVLFETGSQMVVNDLAYGSCNNTTFGVLMSSCHLLLCSEHDFKVVFVKRHANGDYTYFG